MDNKSAQYVDAALRLHGLELDEACRTEVGKQFALLTSMNQLVESEKITADMESASIFRL
jgi:hypothetical protein